MSSASASFIGNNIVISVIIEITGNNAVWIRSGISKVNFEKIKGKFGINVDDLARDHDGLPLDAAVLERTHRFEETLEEELPARLVGSSGYGFDSNRVRSAGHVAAKWIARSKSNRA